MCERCDKSEKPEDVTTWTRLEPKQKRRCGHCPKRAVWLQKGSYEDSHLCDRCRGNMLRREAKEDQAKAHTTEFGYPPDVDFNVCCDRVQNLIYSLAHMMALNAPSSIIVRQRERIAQFAGWADAWKKREQEYPHEHPNDPNKTRNLPPGGGFQGL